MATQCYGSGPVIGLALFSDTRVLSGAPNSPSMDLEQRRAALISLRILSFLLLFVLLIFFCEANFGTRIRATAFNPSHTITLSEVSLCPQSRRIF